jgi:MFS family permease
MPLFILPVYVNLLKSEGISEQLSRASTNETFNQSLLSFKEIISAKSILSLTYGRFMFAVTSAVITTLYGVYAVNEFNIPPALYALFFTLRGLANTFARLPTGRLSDRIGRQKPLISSFILFTLVFLLLSVIQHSILISLLIFLYGMAHGIRAVSEWSFLGCCVKKTP